MEAPKTLKMYRPRKRSLPQRESALYDKLKSRLVRCNVCAFRCVIHPGHVGVCSVRHNVNGVLQVLNYNRVTACHVDPMEKKPLYHFHPGTPAMSLGAPGCNFRCRFCQNFFISQMPLEERKIEGRPLTPKWVVEEAVRRGCSAIAYTYTEPTVFIEYAEEVAVMAKERGLKNVFVTNGYQTPEVHNLMRPWLDAVNVDLKGINDRFYLKTCSARVGPVKESIKRFHDDGIWTEVSTVVIPGRNDSDEDLRETAAFLAGIDRDIPWHVNAFHPDYQMMDVPPTPVAELRRAAAIGREAGLRYVYIGNVWAPGAEDTLCPGCGATVIRREGMRLTGWNLQQGRCACGTTIPGVGLEEAPEGLSPQAKAGIPCG